MVLFLLFFFYIVIDINQLDKIIFVLFWFFIIIYLMLLLVTMLLDDGKEKEKFLNEFKYRLKDGKLWKAYDYITDFCYFILLSYCGYIFTSLVFIFVIFFTKTVILIELKKEYSNE